MANWVSIEQADMGKRVRIGKPMKVWMAFVSGLVGVISIAMFGSWAAADQALFVAYPPPEHQTTADRIFFIGTAAPAATVRINNQVIEHRSQAGHFAPTVPLALGENRFTLSHQDQTLTYTVTRLPRTVPTPPGLMFAENSLTPRSPLARLPGELICFGAIAPPQAIVSVQLANQQIPLQLQPTAQELPNNSAVLTNQVTPFTGSAAQYAGCITPQQPGNLGTPEFRLTLRGQTITQAGAGPIEIWSPTAFQVAEVTVAAGTARTGPSTDYSRLTPLPQGTQAVITGREGDWLRLDYGGWIRANETRVFTRSVPPHSLIRGIRSAQVPGWTEIIFPLQVPVPLSVSQETTRLTLTLYNISPQTDTIYFAEDPVVERMDWYPVLPDQANYVFHFKDDQQWGYKLRYEGTNLILSLKHPPLPAAVGQPPLQGTTILLDPGHGGDELGSRGPTGYPEKSVALLISQKLREQLQARGAQVIMTRDRDLAVSLSDRTDLIKTTEPTLALSLHYNALPDEGDALNTAGVAAFWYHPQAHDLARFLQRHLVTTLARPDYGVYWNNLALTRPQVTPAVLLELGFMINPDEFEWVTDSASQSALALALADGIEQWVTHRR